MAMQVKIFITLKQGVLDPQGLSIKNALNVLGFTEVEDVRMGKYLELRLGGDKEDVSATALVVKEMCRKLLTNPVIEDYTYQVIDQVRRPDPVPGGSAGSPDPAKNDGVGE